MSLDHAEQVNETPGRPRDSDKQDNQDARIKPLGLHADEKVDFKAFTPLIRKLRNTSSNHPM